MSRSQITCPKCKRPLADRRHSGRIVVYSDVRSLQITTRGVELECPVCGTRRVLTPPDNQVQAA